MIRHDSDIAVTVKAARKSVFIKVILSVVRESFQRVSSLYVKCIQKVDGCNDNCIR